MEIYIKTLTGKTICLEVDYYDTVESVKMLIEEKEAVAVKNQRLIFAGMKLEDGTTLKENNVKNGSTLNLVFQSLVGGI